MHGSKLNQEATEKYSRQFSDKILEEFFANRNGISGQEIISLTPIKQVNFFVLKVLFEQWQEETKKFRSPFFNYKNSEVNQALKNLVNTLSKHILIEKEDFRPLLERATSETMYLLHDPENFYLSQVDRFSKGKDIRSISKYIKVHKPLFESLAEHLPEVDGDLAAAIASIDVSELINVNEIQQTTDDFNTILEMDVLSNEESIQDNLETFEDVGLPEINAHESVEEKSLNGHHTHIEDEMDGEFSPLGGSSETPPENVNEKFSDLETKTVNEQYQINEVKETVASKHESASISELAASISINQRYMFLSDLFGGNETDYNGALEAIESSDSFDDSVEILVQNYAKKYSWEMSSDEVKEFLKVIFKRFR